MVEAVLSGATQSLLLPHSPEEFNGGSLFPGFVEGSGVYKGIVRPLGGVTPQSALNNLFRSERQQNHAEAVADWVVVLSGLAEPELPEQTILSRREYTQMHDMGKGAFLFADKPSLTPSERMMLHHHPLIAADIMKQSGTHTGEGYEIPILHHENVDGSGYPFGLKGDAIPIAARIARISDTLASMTMPRSWEAIIFSPEKALTEMQLDEGRLFDAHLLELLGHSLPYLLDGSIFKMAPKLNGAFHASVSNLDQIYGWSTAKNYIADLPLAI